MMSISDIGTEFSVQQFSNYCNMHIKHMQHSKSDSSGLSL